MSKTIVILQDKQFLQSLDLEDGTYVIGRDPAADIVLDSRTISKKHAVLDVSGKKVCVTDCGSANGIYWRGSKIAEQVFKDDFEIELPPFVLRSGARVSGNAGPGRLPFAMPGFAGDFFGRNMKAVLFAVLTGMMLVSLMVIYLPLNSRVESMYQEERLKTGVLLCRHLAEMNRPFLETREHSLVRTGLVLGENGVLYAFVLDNRGRIIAPHEKQGDFFNWEKLPLAMREDRVHIDRKAGGENLIFNPIRHQGQLLGAAVIGFSPGSTRGTGSAGIVFFLFMVLVGWGLLVSSMLAKALLRPVKRLHEEVELSIKQGRDHIELQVHYKELENLKHSINRLLLRKPFDMAEQGSQKTMPGAAQPVTSGDNALEAHSSPVDGNAPQTNTSEDPAAAITDPWCLVSSEAYTLVRLSETFNRVPGMEKCKEGMHIIEAFDSETLLSVTKVIEAPGETAKITVAGKTYQLRGTGLDMDSALVRIVFKEKQ